MFKYVVVTVVLLIAIIVGMIAVEDENQPLVIGAGVTIIMLVTVVLIGIG